MTTGSPQKDNDSPLAAAEVRPGGRVLFALLTVAAGGLLLMQGTQTQPGFEGGDWWNEPVNAPAFSLTLLFVCSLLAAIFASPTDQGALRKDATIAVILSAAFLGAIWCIPIIGYGLSVLVFATIGGLVAGYRGRVLLLVALGLTALMLLTFRYVLGLWFPRAELFKLTPWLEAIGAYI